MIPLTRPSFDAAESEACARVLQSGMLVQGEQVREFEAELARITGRGQVVAVGNGTQALELALRALEIGPGDHVLCPGLTWPSPAHAIKAAGATPVLVDIDGDTWNGSAQGFAEARTPQTRCAITIDQFGSPADHPAIAAALPGVLLIVDGACSLGSELAGRSPLAHGSIACTSFHPRKIVTTGEGGACFTDDAAIAERLRTLRNHGQRVPGEFVMAAGNARLTELQAAVGRAQLGKLTQIVAARRELRAHLLSALPALTAQAALPHARINGQTFGIRLSARIESEAARSRLIAELAAEGVMAGKLSYALSQLPQFAAEARPLPVAESLALRGLALPLYPGMAEQDVAQLIRVVDRQIVQRGFA